MTIHLKSNIFQKKNTRHQLCLNADQNYVKRFPHLGRQETIQRNQSLAIGLLGYSDFHQENGDEKNV